MPAWGVSGSPGSSENTVAPSSRNWSAIASPMPRAAPVTTATLPSNAPFAAMVRPFEPSPRRPQYISQPPLTLIVAPVM